MALGFSSGSFCFWVCPKKTFKMSSFHLHRPYFSMLQWLVWVLLLCLPILKWWIWDFGLLTLRACRILDSKVKTICVWYNFSYNSYQILNGIVVNSLTWIWTDIHNLWTDNPRSARCKKSLSFSRENTMHSMNIGRRQLATFFLQLQIGPCKVIRWELCCCWCSSAVPLTGILACDAENFWHVSHFLRNVWMQSFIPGQ